MQAPAVVCPHCHFTGPPLAVRAGLQPAFVLLGLTGIGLVSALVGLLVAAHARRPSCARCLRFDGLQDSWLTPTPESAAVWHEAVAAEAVRFARSQRRNWLLFAVVLAVDIAVVGWAVGRFFRP
jgi:hypothetical protein